LAARYEHGVLVVTIPVAQMAQARRIAIDGAQPVEVVEAHDGDAYADDAAAAGNGHEVGNGHTREPVHSQ
jgi:hypothetical protein